MTISASAQRKDILPDDVLTAILTLAKEAAGTTRLEFRGHDSKLQRVFRKLVVQYDNPLMKKFVFSESGPEPYSPILTESISRLQLSGLVGRENPDYEKLFLRPAAQDYFDQKLKQRFTNNEIDELTQIGRRFWQLVKK